MELRLSRLAASLVLLAAPFTTAQEPFTIYNGQIFTPGFTVLNAPQPATPLGGDTLHISLDVTAKGKLPLLLDEDSPSKIFNVTVFLYSYDTGRNFTVTNGTAGEDDASLGDILKQEQGSTVKHINWIWPDCLVGDGKPDSEDSDRGTYNISIRQNFRLNGTDHYTIFDVPIAVTNSIEADDARPPCDILTNELLSPEEIDMESANKIGILFAPDDATQVDFEEDEDGDDESDDKDSDDKDGDDEDPPFGGQREEAGPGDGLGGGPAMFEVSWTLLAAGALLGIGI